MEGVSLPSGIPGLGASTDPLEAVLGPFPCVKCLNLPFDVTFEDIVVLFQGLVVLDVLIVGQGEAFVVFTGHLDFQMALQRDRKAIGRRMVEISAGSRADYYEAIAMHHIKEHHPQQSRAGEGGVRRGDQPGSAVAQQMSSDSSAMWGSSAPGLGFFQHQQREKEQHQGGSDPMGGHGPIGIVPGMGLGSGGVGGSESRLSGVGGRPVPGPPNVKRTGGGIQVGEHTGFLRMRGLPFSSTKDDIFKFFDGYNPVQESIVLTYRSDGRATGEAYVGFITPDDSKKAMDLHRKSMGTRYIELFISNKEEHGRALQRFGNR